MLTPQERVANGVAALDAWDPTWWKRLADRRPINISSCTDCVIGQLFNNSSGSISGWLNGCKAVGVIHDQTMQHGFRVGILTIDGVIEAREELNAEWARVIDQRLAAQSTPNPTEEPVHA